MLDMASTQFTFSPLGENGGSKQAKDELRGLTASCPGTLADLLPTFALTPA